MYRNKLETFEKKKEEEIQVMKKAGKPWKKQE